MAENLAGFAATCPLAVSLVMVIAGIGGKPLFAALAFPLLVFHKNTTENRYAGTAKKLKTRSSVAEKCGTKTPV